MTWQELVVGKHVAVVGPAPSLLKTGYGSLIDSYSVVVRINSAVPNVIGKHAADFGRRADVIYHSWYGDTNRIRPQKLAQNWGVRGMATFPLDLNWHRPYGVALRDLCVEDGMPFREATVYSRVKADLGFRPTTGYLAIRDLLSLGAAHLHVAGFTFSFDYITGYPSKTGNVHNPASELANLAEISQQRQDMSFDPALNFIIQAVRKKNG